MRLSLKLCMIAVAVPLASVVGCGPSGGQSDIVADGVIYSVAYSMEDGKVGGFTRLNNSKAVPNGNGSWNIDAYGKLTRDFLIITRPQLKNLGPEIIPAHRLVSIQFGDGGIKTVDESHPK
jgi:hypothetical protein